MKVSMKVDYGLRALVDLAQHYGQGPIQSKVIARRQDIPEPYLEHVLTNLRRAGVIASRRGPLGGHSLARHPGEIRLDQVIATMEGSMAPISCVDKAVDCSRADVCATRDVWRAVAEATKGVLVGITIQELASRQTPPGAGLDTGAKYVNQAP